jgi:hypothetical protein
MKAEIPKNSDPVMILDFSAAKFAALCRRANRIGAVILTGRAPNPAMGAFRANTHWPTPAPVIRCG